MNKDGSGISCSGSSVYKRYFSYSLGKLKFVLQRGTTHSRRARVAVLVPSKNLIVDTIAHGVQETLAGVRDVDYQITTFNAQGSLEVMRSQVIDIMHQRYDLVVTVGSSCSIVAKQVTSYQRCDIPIVFCAVDYTVSQDLVESEACSGNHLTGVTGGLTKHALQASLLCELQENLKRALIPFSRCNPGGVMARCSQEAEGALLERGVEPIKLSLCDSDDVMGAIEDRIAHCQAVIIFRDVFVLKHLDRLIRLCNRNKVALVTSDWYSVGQGAAMGFAASDYVTGVAAAQKVREIIEAGKRPSQIPITTPNYNYHMLLNYDAIREQGFQMNHQALSELKAAGIV